MLYFFLTILFILFKDRIILILTMPLIIFYFKKHKIKKDMDSINDSTLKKQNIKSKIKKYLSGYIHYYLLKTSQIPSQRFRKFIYGKVCKMQLSRTSVIYHGVEIREPQNICIGEGSIIGDNSILDGRNGIFIGNNVNFSSNVRIWTQQHDHRDPWFRCDTQLKGPVKIDDRAWIGPHTIILHSVHIGEGAVVAAGAVVTKDVPPFSIVAGIPATIIGERNHNLKYSMNGSYVPFW